MVCDTLPVPTSSDIDVASVGGTSVAPAGTADETRADTAMTEMMRYSLKGFTRPIIPQHSIIVNM